jgi:uncharacterized phage-associated protein
MPLSFEFDFEATKAALVHLASKDLPGFDKYRAGKLLFLADRCHLLRFGRPITGDRYFALPYGPTPDRVLALLTGLEVVALEGNTPDTDEVAELARSLDVANLDHPTYSATVQVDADALSITDLEVLDQIAEKYGRTSFNELRNLTHGMKAYTAAWREGGIRRKFPIAFEDFFDDDPHQQEFLNELVEEQRIEALFAAEARSPKAIGA